MCADVGTGALYGVKTGGIAALLNRRQHELSFLERLGLLIDQQWTWRENQALARRLKNPKLRGNPCVEDIDYRAARGLERA